MEQSPSPSETGDLVLCLFARHKTPPSPPAVHHNSLHWPDLHSGCLRDTPEKWNSSPPPPPERYCLSSTFAFILTFPLLPWSSTPRIQDVHTGYEAWRKAIKNQTSVHLYGTRMLFQRNAKTSQASTAFIHGSGIVVRIAANRWKRVRKTVAHTLVTPFLFFAQHCISRRLIGSTKRSNTFVYSTLTALQLIGKTRFKAQTFQSESIHWFPNNLNTTGKVQLSYANGMGKNELSGIAEIICSVRRQHFQKTKPHLRNLGKFCNGTFQTYFISSVQGRYK